MHSLLFIVSNAAVLVLTVTFALPQSSHRIPIRKVSNLVENGQVNIGNLRSHLAYVEQKYLNGAAALQRYTGAQSSSNDNTLARRYGSPDLLTDVGNAYWYGTISVGTPAVKYTVIFDSGSADFIIPSKACNATCDGHTRYDPSASSSAVDLHASYNVRYADHSESGGEQYTETVNFASYVATNQTIGAALWYSSQFQIANFIPDGIVGLAFSSISAMPANSVFQTIYAEEQFPGLPFITFKLASEGSELYIGGLDKSAFTGYVTYTDVIQLAYWQIKVDSVNVNGKAIRENFSAIVDTGTEVIAADANTVSQFYASLQANPIGDGFYAIPCDATLDVSFTIEGETYPIPAEVFKFWKFDTECLGGLVSFDLPEDTWVLGDVFLRNVYTIFDLGKLRVGFAVLA